MIYGLKQETMTFRRELVKDLTGMTFKISAADPCLIIVGHCMDWWSGYHGLKIVRLLGIPE
jgi:hypothetical protein